MNGTNAPIITMDQWMGFVRQGVPFAAGIAVGKGWLTTSEAGDLTALSLQIGGPLFLVGGGIWSYIANSRKSALLAVAKNPNVAKVVVSDPAIVAAVAAAVPNGKVVNAGP